MNKYQLIQYIEHMPNCVPLMIKGADGMVPLDMKHITPVSTEDGFEIQIDPDPEDKSD